MEVTIEKTPDKKFFESKKCVAYLILMITSTAIIGGCLYTGQDSGVIREALSSFGLAVTAASTALIGGQSFVDGKKNA